MSDCTYESAIRELQETQEKVSEKNQRINELGDENVKMRDALTRILGWRERDRESLGEVLRWIEGEARAGLAR